MKICFKININLGKKRIVFIAIALCVVAISISVFQCSSFRSDFEITDELVETYFLRQFFSVATTDAQVVQPSDSVYVGNPKSCISVRLKSRSQYTRVRIDVAETPFFSRSVSEFVLEKSRTEYTVYPDIIWNYEALKVRSRQKYPHGIAIHVEVDGKSLGQRCVHFLFEALMNVFWVTLVTELIFTIPVSFCSLCQRRQSNDW